MQHDTTREKDMVWDPLIRIFHWLLAISFAAAYLMEDEWLRLHALAGSVILGLLVFRIVWGFAGTPHARLADFLYPPRQVVAHLGGLLHRRPSGHVGHTPAGSVMIFALLAGLLLLCMSGVVLYGLEGFGPMTAKLSGTSLKTVFLIECCHGLVADTVAIMIVLHIGGVLVESLLLKKNLTMSMLTGRKCIPPKEFP